MLSSKLEHLVQDSSISNYNVGRNTLLVSHLFYANDVLVFTNGAKKSLRNLMQLLQAYERSSGQMVNLSKSNFYIDDKYERRAAIISRVMGM